MDGLSSLLVFAALLAAVPIVALVAFTIYGTFKYCPIISRVFEERPLFQPLTLIPDDRGEEVVFPAADGLELKGSYFKARTKSRVGVLVFCHEFLSDRWSFAPYVDGLRDRGFDVFSFDFRNHGESAVDPSYSPLQYASNRELDDLNGALAYLRSRPDRDKAGFGLFGVSRGGGAALLAGSNAVDVWGVITDGAFPTRGTMIAYMLRWAEIYVSRGWVLAVLPRVVYYALADVAKRRSQRKLNCVFPSVERAVATLAPRPWLQIHGKRDVYIGTDIAQTLFARARDPKDQWLVDDAKHNRCRETAPEDYARRLADFVDRHAPRRPLVKKSALDPVAGDRFGDFSGATAGRPPKPELITNVASTLGG